MNLSTRGKLLLAGLVVILGSFLLGAGIAYAGDTPVHRGDICSKIGEERKDKSGDVYVCVQKPGDQCPRFRAKHPGHGGQPLPPCVCPSKSANVSPSVSPSASVSPSKPPASPSTSASPSKSATAAGSPSTIPQPSTVPVSDDDKLPVTGTRDVIRYAGIGLLAVGLGALLYLGPKFRIRRRSI